MNLPRVLIQRIRVAAEAIAADPNVIVYSPRTQGSHRLVWAQHAGAPETTLFQCDTGLQFCRMNAAVRARLWLEIRKARAAKPIAKEAAA